MPIFDNAALQLSRDRTARRGESFIDARIWEDLEASIALLARRPTRALLLGPMTPAARDTAARLGIDLADDPDRAGEVDLLLLVRWAETEDDLPEKLAALAHLLPADTPLLGAAIGGGSLGALRSALLAADAGDGAVVARAHPRLEPGAFAELLQRAGFVRPVVDVDRLDVRYSSLRRLVDDLRDLGAVNRLEGRSRRPVGRQWASRLAAAFPPGTVERFDILQFSAWTADY